MNRILNVSVDTIILYILLLHIMYILCISVFVLYAYKIHKIDKKKKKLEPDKTSVYDALIILSIEKQFSHWANNSDIENLRTLEFNLLLIGRHSNSGKPDSSPAGITPRPFAEKTAKRRLLVAKVRAAWRVESSNGPKEKTTNGGEL